MQLKSKTSKGYRHVILLIIDKTIYQKVEIIFYLPNFLIFLIKTAHIFRYSSNPSLLKILSFHSFLFGSKKYWTPFPVWYLPHWYIFRHHNCNGFIIYLASLLTSVLNRSCVSSYIYLASLLTSVLNRSCVSSYIYLSSLLTSVLNRNCVSSYIYLASILTSVLNGSCVSNSIYLASILTSVLNRNCVSSYIYLASILTSVWIGVVYRVIFTWLQFWRQFWMELCV